MLPVTDRFLHAVRQTHTIAARAAVYAPDNPTVAVPVPVVDGNVSIDRDARVRRQGTLEVAYTLEDAATRDLIRQLPFGGYCAVWRGIRYADGTEELVQLGHFRVDSISWGELQGRATLTLSDRMAQVQDEPFPFPYRPAGMRPSDAAVQIVQDVFGSSIDYIVETTPASEPTLGDTVYDEDRASALSDLAAAADAWATFTNEGDFLLRPRDAVLPLAWTIDTGAAGVMVAATETLDRSNVRNGVAVRGQASAELPPIYALATFDDPTSPLRWGGPFGRVALISSSSSIASQAQADATARSLLGLRLGLARTLVLVSVPNPALEPDDPVQIVFADGRTETHKINGLSIGLGATAALELTTTTQLDTVELEPLLQVFSGADAWRELAGAAVP